MKIIFWLIDLNFSHEFKCFKTILFVFFFNFNHVFTIKCLCAKWEKGLYIFFIKIGSTCLKLFSTKLGHPVYTIKLHKQLFYSVWWLLAAFENTLGPVFVYLRDCLKNNNFYKTIFLFFCYYFSHISCFWNQSCFIKQNKEILYQILNWFGNKKQNLYLNFITMSR